MVWCVLSKYLTGIFTFYFIHRAGIFVKSQSFNFENNYFAEIWIGAKLFKKQFHPWAFFLSFFLQVWHVIYLIFRIYSWYKIFFIDISTIFSMITRHCRAKIFVWLKSGQIWRQIKNIGFRGMCWTRLFQLCLYRDCDFKRTLHNENSWISYCCFSIENYLTDNDKFIPCNVNEFKFDIFLTFTPNELS